MYLYHFKTIEYQVLPLLYEWTMQPHIACWWDEPNMFDAFIKKYTEKIASPTQQGYIVYLQDGGDIRPLGFIQWYDVAIYMPAYLVAAQLHNRSICVHGIDLYIAAKQDYNQGHGYRMMIQFIDYIQLQRQANLFLVDPNITNGPAIRCYKKVGFIQHGIHLLKFKQQLITVVLLVYAVHK